MFKIVLVLTYLVSLSVTAKIPRLSKNYLYIQSLRSKFDDSKIVGGDEVEPNSVPYILSFQFSDGFHFCGGAIYNNKTVITAAHCCEYQNIDDLRIVAGEHDLNTLSEFEQILKIESILIHPDYAGHSNDICLLETKESFIFNDYVSNVPIPEEDQEFEGDAIVTGWGDLEYAGATPTVLMTVTVPLVSHENCQEAYDGSTVDDSMICAGEGGKDACQGDSGGPLTCGGIHCGVVSWGYGCANEKYPGVYAKTSKFTKWIQENAY